MTRAALWSPVAIGIGAGLYFGLKTEPSWQTGLFALAASSAPALLTPRIRKVAIVFLLVALGFAAAELRASRLAAPIVKRDLGIVEITGVLLSVEESSSRRRIVLDIISIENIAEDDLPARARITWRGKDFNASPGDTISMRAGLGPPPPPASPDGFDFARQLYFQKIGTVGFAVTPPVVDETVVKTGKEKIAASIETLRFNIFHRITRAAPGEGGAIVAALVTGKRDAISERSEFRLRDAGLAHLLAISGLHMGLATGLVFFSVRLGLALIEPVALRFPIKKWAALAALASGFIYLILSGGGWSARRAFIMAAIMFVAILLDRRALSLRNVAIAAVFILLTTPEALFHPGFQMSFAAVTALIAAYEWQAEQADPFRSFTWTSRLKRYVLGLAATDVIAAMATAPYALFHFNRIALYSLPANVIAMPLMGFWIMPAAVLALLLAPFGADVWAWRLSALGMETILSVATTVSGWPGSVSLTPQWPLSALLLLTFGGLWLCLSKALWRLAGLAAIPAAAFLVARTTPPDIYVAPSGRNAGVVEHDKGITVYADRRDRFAISMWKEAAGLDPLTAPTASMKTGYACDRTGCVTEIGEDKKTIVSFIEEKRSLAEDCARADLVIAFFPASERNWRACNAVLIDRRSVWRRGAHAIWIEKNGSLTIITAKDIRGVRPWTDYE